MVETALQDYLVDISLRGNPQSNDYWLVQLEGEIQENAKEGNVGKILDVKNLQSQREASSMSRDKFDEIIYRPVLQCLLNFGIGGRQVGLV